MAGQSVRDVTKAWSNLNRALSTNTTNAWKTINNSRRRLRALIK